MGPLQGDVLQDYERLCRCTLQTVLLEGSSGPTLVLQPLLGQIHSKDFSAGSCLSFC